MIHSKTFIIAGGNMAPVNSDQNSMEKLDDEEDKSIWSFILSQVQTSSLNKVPSGKVVLVLGDNECGKTSLIAKLQGNEDPKKGSGLEYHVIAVKDDYRDDVSRLGIWVLDGDPWHKNLLKFVLNEESLLHTTVLLSASMTQPWDILESLQSWSTILEEHIDRLKIPPEQFEECRQQMLKRYQDYIEPGDDLDAVARKASSPASDDASILLPLGNDTLTHNLGLDIIVVITKTDYMSTLEKEFDYKEEHFDFIQQAVRKFCLRYGASLFYTSVKEDKNCDLLYKFIVHRIYGYSFKTPALVVEKDSVFIPTGWDNDKKIAILYENLTAVTPDDNYSDVIIKPLTRKPLQREAEVAAENDQIFLMRQQTLLSQQQLTPVRQESPVRNPQSVQKSADRRLTGSPGVQANPKKVEGAKPAVGSEGVLQNFFNSLLNRKTGSPTGGITTTPMRPGTKSAKRVLRKDAVPTVFKWKMVSEASKQRRERAQRRAQGTQYHIHKLRMTMHQEICTLLLIVLMCSIMNSVLAPR